MIIINCKNQARARYKKIIETTKNDYIESIEYIDNKFNHILIKETYKFDIAYYNLNFKRHNPIGPADICYENGSIKKEEYWIHGQLHREDGPARIHYSENGEMIDYNYYINGEYIFPNEFKIVVKNWRKNK